MEKQNSKIAAVLFVFSIALAIITSCGGGGGGGSNGISSDRAAGTFTITMLNGTGGYSSDIGTVTFDGAGHGIFTMVTSSLSGTFNYTLSGNDLILDNTLIGSLNAAGNFFTAVDVSSTGTGTNIQLVCGVRSGSGVADTAPITFAGGLFVGNAGPSRLDRLLMQVHTPLVSVLTYTSLSSSFSGTFGYVLASNGTFTLDPAGSPMRGAISEDKNIMMFSDSTGMGVALQLPGSGMSIAKLSGTYKAYRFGDHNLSTGPLFGAGRTTYTFDGAGIGTYQRTADSGGVITSGSLTYTMNADGSLTILGYKGSILADGSVLAIFDDEPVVTNNTVFTMIMIKQ